MSREVDSVEMSRVLGTLSKLRVACAGNISVHLSMHPDRVYAALDALAEKGLVERVPEAVPELIGDRSKTPSLADHHSATLMPFRIAL